MISFQLNKIDKRSAPSKLRLFKIGLNKTTKGEFYLSKEDAQKIIEEYKSYGNKLSFDYNHQQLNEYASIEQGLSAGTFDLELSDLGLYAINIQWTDRAKQLIEAKEYIYTSPAFASIEKDDGKKYIVDIINCALTNLPATFELTQLLEAASKNIFKGKLSMQKEEIKCAEEAPIEEPTKEEMTEDMQPEGPSMEDIKALFDRVAALEEMLKAKEEEKPIEEEMSEEVISPVKEELSKLKAENIQLKQAIELKEKEQLITVALSQNKLFPAQKELYLKLDIESLKVELDKLTAISLGRVVPEIKQEKTKSQGLVDLVIANFNKQTK